ncbi:MAG: NAD(P)/FAD-dependent oxidoreductase [Clostridia bacterium]|nr:NAD(P)/FAD-dependent oxidoreductase [Clostridia bacterium]
MIDTDVLIIGGGVAGLTSAIATANVGVNVTLVHSEELGGLAGHNVDYGYVVNGTNYTGVELADELISRLPKNVKTVHGCVTSLSPNLEAEVVTMQGAFRIKPLTVVLATGGADKSIINLRAGGTHPLGIYTASQVLHMVNVEGKKIGSRIIVVGSGDEALTIAYRLTLEGSKVEAVIENETYALADAVKVAQTLGDFHIPFFSDRKITEIHGKKRIESVTVSTTDENGVISTQKIYCDALVLAMGRVCTPALTPYVELNPQGNGVVIDKNASTSRAGLYACGDVVGVHRNIAEIISEAQRAGRSSAIRAKAMLLKRKGR